MDFLSSFSVLPLLVDIKNAFHMCCRRRFDFFLRRSPDGGASWLTISHLCPTRRISSFMLELRRKLQFCLFARQWCEKHQKLWWNVGEQSNRYQNQLPHLRPEHYPREIDWIWGWECDDPSKIYLEAFGIPRIWNIEFVCREGGWRMGCGFFRFGNRRKITFLFINSAASCLWSRRGLKTSPGKQERKRQTILARSRLREEQTHEASTAPLKKNHHKYYWGIIYDDAVYGQCL